MADEISFQSLLRINSVTGGLNPITRQSPNSTIDQTNKQVVSGVLACTTTPASITLTDLTAKGMAYFQNLGATNAIVVIADDGSGESDAFQLPPGAGYHVHLVDASTYKAKTAAGTSSLFFEAYGA